MESEPNIFILLLQLFGWWIILLIVVPWLAVIAAAHDRGNSMLAAGFVGFFGTPLIGLLYVLAQPINRDVLDERAIRSGSRRRCVKCLSPKRPDATICHQCGAGARVDAPAPKQHFAGG